MLAIKPLHLPTYVLVDSQKAEQRKIGWTLKWRQKQLLVNKEQYKQAQLLAEENEQWLIERLKRSPIKLVRIDAKVQKDNLEIWAKACEQAQKPLFLRINPAHQQPSNLYPGSWLLKRLADFIVSALLLTILSPVFLGLMAWQTWRFPQQPILTRHWCVGKRGKLFQAYKLAAIGTNNQSFAEQMTCNWQNLPQLLNVLRGEMTLIGPRPWTLSDASRLAYLEEQQQLNALPGITGLPQLTEKLLDLKTVSSTHLAYLNDWSLGKDLEVLLQTVPQLFSGVIN